MKIGIYNSPAGHDVGGAEHSVAILAEALGESHDVDIIHHIPKLTTKQLTDFFGVDLSAVSLRYVPAEPYLLGDSRLPWKRYREAQSWKSSLSKPYELFINFSFDEMPPFCQSRIGVLMIMFPFFDPFWPWRREPSQSSSLLWTQLRGFYYDWEWKSRLATYQLKTVNSAFTAQWTERRWGVKCQVVYPPADTNFQVLEKENSIVSVGRFNSTKKYLEMLATFRRCHRKRGLRDWTYFCVGGVGDAPKAQDYYEKVSMLAAECQARIIPNADRPKLRNICEKAKLFWHAAGCGEDDARHPELMEHFGIATVEAMAAGCVPIVINQGGQREIVEHGVNGFLWNSLDELADYTLLLAGDDALWAQMSEAARHRAHNFTREKFVASSREMLKPFLK